MSLIDHFYNVFPEHIVFQILTYKPHPCAELIKTNMRRYSLDLYRHHYRYAVVFSAVRKIQKLEDKKNKLEESIKYENKKLYKYIQCISLHHDKCKNEHKNSGYCITKCVHNDIKKCKDFIKDYNLKCSLLHTEIQMLRVATFTEKSKTF